jgi:hypothetical protein
MEPLPDRTSFVVIGENIHATRSISRRGRHVVRVGDAEQIAFVNAGGHELTVPIAAPVADSADFAAGKVKHIRNAVLLGLGGEALVPAEITGPVTADGAAAARNYLVAAARRQELAGAHYIDVNIDEMAGDEGIRVAAIEWLVRLLEPALGIPLSLDSSSVVVLEAGLRASSSPHGPLMLNSASAERPEVLDLAAATGSPVVLSASGRGSLPSDTAGRVANAVEIVAEAARLGIPPAAMYVDLLVIPVGVDPDAGTAYLDAVRHVRATHGAGIRITGGLSNVSFGLPNRGLLNEAFMALAMDAGVDSGIIDPIGLRMDRALGTDRSSRAYALAADVLTGVDAFAMEYLSAFRAGTLA